MPVVLALGWEIIVWLGWSNGRLVPPGDVAALAAVLQEAADRPDRTIDRWRTGIRPVRSLDDVAADYMKLYQDVCPAPSMLN